MFCVGVLDNGGFGKFMQRKPQPPNPLIKLKTDPNRVFGPIVIPIGLDGQPYFFVVAINIASCLVRFVVSVHYPQSRLTAVRVMCAVFLVPRSSQWESYSFPSGSSRLAYTGLYVHFVSTTPSGTGVVVKM